MARAGADPGALRKCLGRFGTGVVVITTTGAEGHAGMAVNSFAAVSLDPPLILWSIRRSSRSLAAFTRCEHFAVNVLATDQLPVCRLFASPGDDRFARVAWHAAPGGVPLLDDCAATLLCRLEATHDGGDHVIVIGRVVSFEVGAGAPLLFLDGQYGEMSRT